MSNIEWTCPFCDRHAIIAIVDGRQRLEAVWAFIENKFTLANDFDYLLDSNVKAGGLTYGDLGSKYPKLKIRFDSFTLPIICVETEDLELVEDMFSRLNEAVPLNAAEKRNAIGGPMSTAINQVSSHSFFTEAVRFSNKRYQHREVAARLLFIEQCLDGNRGLVDTKKPYLDDMVRTVKMVVATHGEDVAMKQISPIQKAVNTYLDSMAKIFMNADPLLRSQSVVAIFYLLIRDALALNMLARITRAKLIEFFRLLAENRTNAQEDIAKANFDLLEFDRLSQQGTNDAASLKERLRIIKSYFDMV